MKKRIGIELDTKVEKRLQKLANKDGRKLKPYMERVLINHSELVLAVRQKSKK